ncbi:MAG: hypothetical protein H0W83_09175, partial [Planctomycetes bacterium]|nr:hypothetical protein [Planctomycetota bacterium]
SARDQFNLAMSTQPAFTWSASGAGAISSGGLFTAGGSTGAATVSVTGAGSSGSVNVTVGAGGSGTSTAGSGSGGSGGTNCGLGTGFAAVMGLLIALRHARRHGGRAQSV